MQDKLHRPNIDIIGIRDYLQSGDKFTHEQAEALAIVLDRSMIERDTSKLATKGDLQNEIKPLRLEMQNEFKQIRLEMQIFKRDMIIWILGGTFAINNLPNIFKWILKLIGQQ